MDSKNVKDTKKNVNFFKKAIDEFDAEQIAISKPHRPDYKINFDNIDENLCVYYSQIYVRLFEYDLSELPELN